MRSVVVGGEQAQLRTGGAGEWWCRSRSSRERALGTCTEGSLPADARARSSGENHLASWLSPPPDAPLPPISEIDR